MTEAPGLRAAKKRDTWHALREAAIDLVTARGFDAVSVEEIAAAARVSKSTLFNYFDSKEALLFDPDPRDPARWAALAAARPDGEPVWEGLREIVVGFACRDETELMLRKTMTERGRGILEPALAAGELFRGFLRDWVSGRIENDPHLVAILVSSALAVVHTAYRSWNPGEGMAAFEQLLRRGFDLVGRGLLDVPRVGAV